MTLYTLQLLRFVASLLVLLFHLNLASSGYKGVDIFFVISGFVMYYTLFYKPRPTAFKFIIHRFTKIFFLYWVALILLYLILPFKIDPRFLKTFLLMPGHYAVLPVSWSLSYELYFYIVIGTVVYLIRSRHHQLIFFLLFLSCTFITCVNLTPFTLKGSIVNFLLGPNFWEFLLGVGSAFLLKSYHKLINPGISILAALFCCMVLFTVAIPYKDPVSYIVYGILSFFVVFLFTSYEKNGYINDKVARLFKVLGDASYAIYLFSPIMMILIKATDNFSKVVIIATTICFSVLFNQIVENNFLNWSRKVLYRLL